MNLHFIGICGTGAYQVAILAKRVGYNVSGCDICLNKNYNILQKEGIMVYIEHSVEHLKNVDLVIVSPIFLHLKIKNKEVEESIRTKHCVTWEEFLAQEIIKDKKTVVISGTHGKTTICSLLTQILSKEIDNIFTICGENENNVKNLNENPVYIIEAEEYNENFLHYSPDILCINNIEVDHPSQFSDISESVRLYKKLIRQVKKNGYIILNIDDENIKELLEDIDVEDYNVIFYTRERLFKISSVQCKVINFTCDENALNFTIYFDGEEYSRLFNSIGGVHNVYNLVAIYIIASLFNVNKEIIEDFFYNVKSVPRRMELVKKDGNRLIFNDYAHHPTQMRCVLSVLISQYQKDVCVIWKPNQYDRTIYFYQEYIDVLSVAKCVFLLDVAGSGDDKNVSISFCEMIDELRRRGVVTFYVNENELRSFVNKYSSSDSVCVLFSTDYGNEIINKIT